MLFGSSIHKVVLELTNFSIKKTNISGAKSQFHFWDMKSWSWQPSLDGQVHESSLVWGNKFTAGSTVRAFGNGTTFSLYCAEINSYSCSHRFFATNKGFEDIVGPWAAKQSRYSYDWCWQWPKTELLIRCKSGPSNFLTVQVRPHCFNENAPQFVPAAPMWSRIALQNQRYIVSCLPSNDLILLCFPHGVWRLILCFLRKRSRSVEVSRHKWIISVSCVTCRAWAQDVMIPTTQTSTASGSTSQMWNLETTSWRSVAEKHTRPHEASPGFSRFWKRKSCQHFCFSHLFRGFYIQYHRTIQNNFLFSFIYSSHFAEFFILAPP